MRITTEMLAQSIQLFWRLLDTTTSTTKPNVSKDFYICIIGLEYSLSYIEGGSDGALYEYKQ